MHGVGFEAAQVVPAEDLERAVERGLGLLETLLAGKDHAARQLGLSRQPRPWLSAAEDLLAALDFGAGVPEPAELGQRPGEVGPDPELELGRRTVDDDRQRRGMLLDGGGLVPAQGRHPALEVECGPPVPAVARPVADLQDLRGELVDLRPPALPGGDAALDVERVRVRGCHRRQQVAASRLDGLAVQHLGGGKGGSVRPATRYPEGPIGVGGKALRAQRRIGQTSTRIKGGRNGSMVLA